MLNYQRVTILKITMAATIEYIIHRCLGSPLHDGCIVCLGRNDEGSEAVAIALAERSESRIEEIHWSCHLNWFHQNIFNDGKSPFLMGKYMVNDGG
jgi:hypothetical protein